MTNHQELTEIVAKYSEPDHQSMHISTQGTPTGYAKINAWPTANPERAAPPPSAFGRLRGGPGPGRHRRRAPRGAAGRPDGPALPRTRRPPGGRRRGRELSPRGLRHPGGRPLRPGRAARGAGPPRGRRRAGRGLHVRQRVGSVRRGGGRTSRSVRARHPADHHRPADRRARTTRSPSRAASGRWTRSPTATAGRPNRPVRDSPGSMPSSPRTGPNAWPSQWSWPPRSPGP